MKNLKTTMIAALLMLAAVGAVRAQEEVDYPDFPSQDGLIAQVKYEYATLYSLDRMVFWNAEKSEIVEFDKKDNFISGTMKKLNELSEKGWEVYGVTETLVTKKGGITAFKYHLRRKK
jgi:hypothetical protein